ncbi:MAG: hypothetical protein JWM34_478 [Ilumatobacteraceae bacterium]|nr:hypothetical protein [Ilumatobacteraceae bacterium]
MEAVLAGLVSTLEGAASTVVAGVDVVDAAWELDEQADARRAKTTTTAVDVRPVLRNGSVMVLPFWPLNSKAGHRPYHLSMDLVWDIASALSRARTTRPRQVRGDRLRCPT